MAIKSLIKSINFCQNKYPKIKIKTFIIDDNSKDENLDRIKELIKGKNIELVPLKHDDYNCLLYTSPSPRDP